MKTTDCSPRSYWPLAVLCLLAAAPALAQEWTTSFTPEAVGTYVEGGPRNIVVAGAGEPTDKVKAAAQALAAALRASGKAQLVMDDAALGSLAADSDAQVVAKAASLPVEAVAVVRVFPSAPGQPPTAVVSLYDKAGKVLTALSAVQGTPLEPRSGPAPAAALPAPALAAVEQVHKEAADAQAIYDEEYVFLEDAAVVNANSGTVVSVLALAYQGKQKRPLQGAAFYTAIGRKDLAEAYNGRLAGRYGLIILGGLGTVGGSVLATSAAREQSGNGVAPALGWGLVGVSAVAALVGWMLEPHPVKVDEARRLVDEYNQGLKRELGLASAAPSRPAAPALRVGLSVTPWGGAVVLGGEL